MISTTFKHSRQLTSRFTTEVWGGALVESIATIRTVKRASYLPTGLEGFYIRSLGRRQKGFFRATIFTSGFIFGEFLKTRKLAFFQSRAQKKKAAKAAEKAAKARAKKQPLFKKGKRIKNYVVTYEHRAVINASQKNTTLASLTRRMRKFKTVSKSQGVFKAGLRVLGEEVRKKVRRN